MIAYLCENGHLFPLEQNPGFRCPHCGSTSESHQVNEGGLGRSWHITSCDPDIYAEVRETGLYSDYCEISNRWSQWVDPTYYPGTIQSLCPVCGAEPGQGCTGFTGSPLHSAHRQRTPDFEEASP